MPSIEGISGHTHLVALLGNPTHHSLSPATHNLSFQLLGIDAVYLCFDIENDNLGSAMASLRALDNWDGCNLTMPCKQAVIPYLDELDKAAELMGAVNVVKKLDDGRLVGYNTDGVGFMENLRHHGVTTENARMTLMGPGGAGSAILVQAALDGVAHLDVLARRGGTSWNHAENLISRVAAKTKCHIELHDLEDTAALKGSIDGSDILVNATSVGMGDGCTDSLVPPEFLRPSLSVADAIYHPRKTQLIRDAEACGCITVPGLGMLIEQAAAGEAIWYDVRMPVNEIESRLFS